MLLDFLQLLQVEMLEEREAVTVVDRMWLVTLRTNPSSNNRVSRVRSTRAPVDVIMDLELTLTLRKWTRRAMSIDIYPTREHVFTALVEVLLAPDTNCDFVKTLDLSKKRVSIIMEQDSCCSDHVVATSAT